MSDAFDKLFQHCFELGVEYGRNPKDSALLAGELWKKYVEDAAEENMRRTHEEYHGRTGRGGKP